MSFTDIFLIGIGLAMDSFAVSVCKGLSVKKVQLKHCLLCGFYFGLFQGGMPVIGYFLGLQFEGVIKAVDHWIAFILLSLIGANMIREALSGDEEGTDDRFDFMTMLGLAIATSIDALTVGVTFAFLEVSIVKAALIIGIVTFILSFLAVRIGERFGRMLGNRAKIVGGIILIGMGVRILLEHTGIIG